MLSIGWQNLMKYLHMGCVCLVHTQCRTRLRLKPLDNCILNTNHPVLLILLQSILYQLDYADCIKIAFSHHFLVFSLNLQNPSYSLHFSNVMDFPLLVSPASEERDKKHGELGVAR